MTRATRAQLHVHRIYEQAWSGRHLAPIRDLKGKGSIEEVNGVALLIHNHTDRASDQWMWTPALQRDRRIALQDRSTRFFGTDFSFEDLE